MKWAMGSSASTRLVAPSRTSMSFSVRGTCPSAINVMLWRPGGSPRTWNSPRRSERQRGAACGGTASPSLSAGAMETSTFTRRVPSSDRTVPANASPGSSRRATVAGEPTPTVTVRGTRFLLTTSSVARSPGGSATSKLVPVACVQLAASAPSPNTPTQTGSPSSPPSTSPRSIRADSALVPATNKEASATTTTATGRLSVPTCESPHRPCASATPQSTAPAMNPISV